MAESVVGVLRAILTADTAQFDTGMRKASAGLNALGKESAALGTQIAKLTPTAERMVKVFTGDKLISQANNLAAAVERVGGAAKLTEAEQARVNRTLTEALAKYAALGQTAPKALQDLEQATRRVEVAQKSLGQTGNKVFQDINALAKGFQGKEVIGEAARMASAIEKIGGATKLTATEKERVNRVLTEAIQKYQALGKAAPKAMLDLAEATKRVEPPTSFLQTKMIALGAAIGSFIGTIAAGAVQQLGQSLLTAASNGAKLSQLSLGFERLSRSVGQTGDAMLRATRAATKGLIADLDLMQVSNKAILLGLPVTASEMGKLAQTAVVLGRAMGLDATQALDDLVTALGRSSPLLLDNLGLSVKVGEANEAYAKSLNKTVNELTDAEKKMAFYNAAMEAAGRATAELGGLQLGVIDQFHRLTIAAENYVTSQAKSANESSIFARALGFLADELERTTRNYDELAKARERAARSGQSGVTAVTAARAAAEEERARAIARAGTINATPELRLPPGGFTPRGVTAAELRELDKQTAALLQHFQKLADLSAELFGQDVIGRAQDLVAVIGPLSNVSRLSAEQQADVNRVMTEAIAVYTRLGKDAPAALLALQQATMALLPSLNEQLRLTISLAPALDDARASLDAYFLVVSSNIDDAFRLTEATRALNEELRKRGMAPPDFSAFESSGASQEARDIAAADRAERAAKRLEELTHSFGRVRDAAFGHFGTLLAGQFGHDPLGILKDAAKEAELEYLKLQRRGTATAKELQIAFDRWREAEERASFTFAERLKTIWGGIKTSIIDVLNDILGFFVKNFIGGMLKAMGAARLGQSLANSFSGAGGVGGGIGGVAQLASAVPGLIGGGGAAAGFTTINAAGMAVTPGLAGAGGLGAAPGAGAASGLGFLANPAFWTNPWTIGAAAAITTGLLVWKKGLFRGGEEGVKVNPRRDKFLAQFGDPSNKGVGGAADNLATLLVARTGNDAQLSMLQRADSVKAFEAAQASLVGTLARLGRRVQSFQFGGFIPPGVVQPAILHGGAFGEMITPLQGRGHPSGHRTVNVYIQGVLDRDSVREVMREHVWPEFNREMSLNQHGAASSVRRTR